MLLTFLLFLSAFAAVPQYAVLGHVLNGRLVNNEQFASEAYHEQPWDQSRMEGFSPQETERAVFSHLDSLTHVPTPTTGEIIPTKTKAVHIMPRLPQYSFSCGPECYTFACPTSVQCNEGGCCPIGLYCGIKNGQPVCCSFDSPCDTAPIPGCSLSCYGLCCDLFQDIIGIPVCSPTLGAQGQASGICTGSIPVIPTVDPTSCSAGTQFFCGGECCPSGAGLICDNTTIPGSPFCNIPL